jgi:hypothetical protein
MEDKDLIDYFKGLWNELNAYVYVRVMALKKLWNKLLKKLIIGD